MKIPPMARRLLSLVLAAALCFSLVPWTAFAAESGAYTQVTSAEEFTTGQYVLITDTGVAPGVYDNGSSPWITAAAPTVAEGVVTDTAGAVWTLTVEGSTVKLTDANGVTVAPKGGDVNGIISGDYSWEWSFADGRFTFAGVGGDTVLLASNNSSGGKFRGYKTATVSGNPSSYPTAFTAYKLAEGPAEPEVPSEPEIVISTIAEARAMASGTEGIAVEGTVILVDGRNVVVQDATGGINLYFSAAPADIAVGDVIRATGKRGAYNGLEQLTGVSEYEKTGTAELPAKEVTVADILADQDTGALESTRVLIKGAVLGEIDTASNTPLTQDEASVNIYKIPALEGIAAGDTVDVYAVIGDFRGYQLRVAAADHVIKAADEDAPAWADVDRKYDVYELVTAPENGDVVAIYNPGNARALSSTDSGYYKAGVEAAVTGENYIASDSDFIAWTVSIGENGLWGFTQEELKLGVELSGSYINLKTNAGDHDFVVTPYTEGGDLYRVRSNTVQNSYGFAYLEWYASKSAFSAYATSEEKATEQNFGFRFYKLVREGIAQEPEVPTEPSEPEEPAGSTATLVTDAAALKAGDQIVIVASEADFALGTTQNNNNRAQAAVTKSEDGTTVTYGQDTQVITLEAGLTEGTWAFQVGGYLYAASSSSNYLRTEETLSANSSWTVEIADGIATIKSTGGNTRNWLRYNSGSSIFACYASGQKDVRIYKLGGAEEEEPEIPQVPAGIADGDYVIWVPGYNKALSSEKTGNYNVGVDVTLTGDALSGYGASEIWTVTNNDDGTITIAQNGSKLSMQASYASLSMDAVNDTWTLTDLGDGLFNVQNVGRGNYLEWYNQYSNWSTYNSTSAATDPQFQIMFTPAVAQEEPEVPAGIADGDYVIWAPAYNMALSTVYNGFYNTGVAVTLEGEKLSGYGSTEVWTVTNNEDGTITISCGSGKLSMDTGYSSMPLNKVNDTWTIEDAGNGLWYVKNVGRESYIEWYADKNNWSGYNTIGAGKEGMFALQFTPAAAEEEPEVPTGIADGDYVIWAPAYNMALSTVYGGYYNNGVAVTLSGDTLTGYDSTEIWTVTNNSDGTITISCSGGKLAMGTGFSSMPLNEVNDTWTIEDAGEGLWYVKNVGRGAYIEWYASNKYWSGYGTINPGSEGMFALRFTPVEKGLDTDSSVVQDIAQWGGMPDPANTASIPGDKYLSGDELDTEDIFTAVVGGQTVTPYTVGGQTDAPLYYMGGKGLGSGSDDYLQLAVNTAGWGDMELSFRLRASNSGAGSFQLKYSADGGATWQNFTTGLSSYGWTKWGQNEAGESIVLDSGVSTGNIADGIAKTSLNPGGYIEFFFDVPTGADDCENLLIRLVPGTEKANGKDGAIGDAATVRMDTVVLSGSPVVDASITGFVTVVPDGTVDQPAGTELTMTSGTEGAVIRYRVNGGQWQTYDEADKPVLDTLPCHVEAYASAEGKRDSVVRLFTYAAGTVEPVKFTPNGGGIYIAGESETITLSTATEGTTIYYATSADGVTFTDYAVYTDAIVVNKGFGKLTIRAYAEKEGYTTGTEVELTFTERLSDTYQIFFGQLHSHTNISDGSGSVEEAFQHASQVNNLDFLAVTDHSNSFDGEGNGVLAEDGSTVSSEWALGHEMAEKYTSEDFVGLYGFEMTWSNGLGHINTFNTPGWQSRTQADYKTQSTALQNYYQALATVPGSISQFNHPGTTFGDFSDFAHYSEGTDALITLIEVGNGEGAIGSSGYFPSYEYYTRALDKGWHVAPTNNQDNHKGLWGDANTGRTVILADSLTETDIYDALRNYRVYATEDNDLNIYYTLNGNIMGSQLDITTAADTVSVRVQISDPTDTAIGKVEVIVNGGLSAASRSLDAATGTLELEVPADYNYYYIKITQPDGDIAVTAPVWVGKVEAVGIASLTAESALTIAGQEQTFTAELYNNERKELIVESLVFTDKANGEVIYTETGITAVSGQSTAVSTFGHAFAADGVYTITATLKGTLNGIPKTYTKDLEVTVMPGAITSRIIVDGTHYNDYVTGYYGGNMNNMTAIAAARGIQVHVEKNAITPEMLENCSLLVISAPAKKNGTDNAGAYTISEFEDEFIDLVAEYVKNGGNLVVCGLADYQDKTNDGIHETSVQLNKLLAAVGSSMRINDDEAYDEENNGGQAYRLYPETFNTDSVWCAGIVEGQQYSQYSGCTVDPGSGTWLVKGFDTTYSIDSDKDGKGGVAKGEAYFLAVEDSGFGGNIFAAGGVFLSDFEVKAELDNIWSLPYANRTIFENIIGVTRTQPAVTPIADVRASAEEALGRIFVIEGYVTSGTDNPYTTFFDAIYVQDETGGITVFPYSETGLELGTKVRITGYTDAYQGDIEIQIMSLEILDEPKNVIEPEKLLNADAMNYGEHGGELIQVEGEVVEVLLSSARASGQGVSQFVVKDENGDLAKVFIDGYILSGTTGENTLADIVEVGNTVSAVGLLYMHPEGDSEESVAVLRVRNCDEVILISRKPAEEAPEIDRTELEKAIEKAEKLEKDDYSAKTWKALQDALKKAKEVLEEENATQKQIDDATAALYAAIRALAPPTTSPETSDTARPELALAVMTVSLLAALVLLWNRKKFLV